MMHERCGRGTAASNQHPSVQFTMDVYSIASKFSEQSMTNDHLMIHFWCIMCINGLENRTRDLEVIYI